MVYRYHPNPVIESGGDLEGDQTKSLLSIIQGLCSSGLIQAADIPIEQPGEDKTTGQVRPIHT